MFSILNRPICRARVLLPWLLLVSVAMASSAHASNAMTPVTVLFESSDCGSESATLEWLSDAARLQAIHATLASSGGAPPALPAIDPGAQPVLLLSMGTQPTPGYRVSPGAELPHSDADTLMVPMRWSQPPPGLMLPQVITTPCLLFSVANGNFNRIEIIDQQGKARLSATRP